MIDHDDDEFLEHVPEPEEKPEPEPKRIGPFMYQNPEWVTYIKKKYWEDD